MLEDGEWHLGFATAWRAERVSVEYTTAPGMRHLAWVPAERVKRVEGLLQDVEDE